MAARPSKKQRIGPCHKVLSGQEPASKGSYFLINSKSQAKSCLEGLVRDLVQVLPNDTDKILDISIQIRSWLSQNPIENWSDATVKKLHGVLVLRIEKFLSCAAQYGDNQEVLHSLVKCLQDLIKLKRNGPERSGLLARSQLEQARETIIVLTNLIMELHSQENSNSICHSTMIQMNRKNRDLSDASFQIISSLLLVEPNLLDTMMQESKSNDTCMDNIMLSTLLTVSWIKDLAVKKEGKQMLSSIMCSAKNLERTSIQQKAMIATKALQMTSNISCISVRLDPEHSTLKNRVWCWRCLACFHFQIKEFEDQNSRLIEQAVEEILQVDNIHPELPLNVPKSTEAMKCVAYLIPMASRSCCSCVVNQIGVILNKMKRTWRPMDEEKYRLAIYILECLESCKKKVDFNDFQNPKEMMEPIFASLLDWSVKATDVQLSQKASKLLLSMIRSIVDYHKQSWFLSCRQCLRLMGELLSSNQKTTVTEAINLFHIILKMKIKRPKEYFSFVTKDLTNCLIRLIDQDFVSQETKEKLMQSFIILICDKNDVNIHGRDPTILQLLIVVANEPFSDNDGRLRKAMTISILLDMAKNPCNRRVLAKTPGLLSTMIRYMRAGPDETTSVEGRTTPRDEVKRQIYLLAEAL